LADILYQDIGHAGAAVTFQAATGGGDTTAPDPKGFLWVKNGGGGAITVTIEVPGQTFGQNNANVAVSVPNGGERLIGPLVSDLGLVFGQSFFITISYSGVTSVTVASVRLSEPPPDLP